MKDIISKTPDAQVMGDLDACVAWAAQNGGNVRQAGHHRLLLGRPHHLAVRGPQSEGEGRRGLVRPPDGRVRRQLSQASGRHRAL
jgi:hypothetical protein